MKKLVMGLLLCMGCCSVVESSMGMHTLPDSSTLNNLSRINIDVNMPYPDGETLLQKALNEIYFLCDSKNKLEIVCYLVDQGANICKPNGDYYKNASGHYNALDICIAGNMSVDKIFNIARKQNIENLDLFEKAILCDRVDLASRMISKNLIEINPIFKTALRLAAQNCSENIVRLLIQQVRISEQGAKLNEQDEDGNTPLHIAAQYDSVSIVNLLLQNPYVEVNIINNEGFTPFGIAAKYHNPSVIESLLSSQNINVTHDEGVAAVSFILEKSSWWGLYGKKTDKDSYFNILRTLVERGLVFTKEEKEYIKNILTQQGCDPLYIPGEPGVGMFCKSHPQVTLKYNAICYKILQDLGLLEILFNKPVAIQFYSRFWN